MNSSMISLYVMALLIGLFAHQKGKNGIIFGIISLLLAYGLCLFMVYVAWDFSYAVGLDNASSISIFSALTIGGGFYGYLRAAKPKTEE